MFRFNVLTGNFDLVDGGGGGGPFATASFTTIAVPAGTPPVADSVSDTLTFTSSGGTLTITGTAGSDTVNFDLTNPLPNSFSTIAVPNGTAPVADSTADTLTYTSTGGTLTITGNATTDTINIDLTNPLPNSFSTIAVPNGTNPVADSTSDTLTYTSTDSSITITGTAASDTIDFILASGINANKIADGTVSNTEFQFINSLTSNAQDQLDAKLTTTLASAKLWVGNGSNVATAVTITGDVSFSNAGVATVAYTHSLGNSLSEYFGSGATGSGVQQVVIGNGTNGGSGSNNVIIGRSSSGSTAGNDVIVGQSSSAGTGGGACGLGNNVTIGTGSTGMGAVCNIQKDSVGMGSGTLCQDTTTGRNIAIGKTAAIMGTSNNCLAIGTNALIPTGLTNVAVIGSDQTPYTAIHYGQGYTSTSQTHISWINTARTGSNVAGSNTTWDAGNGTGTGGSGKFVWRTAPVAASSSTANTLTSRMELDNAGKLTKQMGQSASTVVVGGSANVNVTPVGNVTTGEDDLITYSLPGDSLNQTGDHVDVEAWGTFAANGNSKQLRMYFGATAIFDSGSLGLNDGHWRLTAKILRTGAATQQAIATIVTNKLLLIATTTYSEPAETLSGAIIIKCTGEATDTDDIVEKGMTVKAYQS